MLTLEFAVTGMFILDLAVTGMLILDFVITYMFIIDCLIATGDWFTSALVIPAEGIFVLAGDSVNFTTMSFRLSCRNLSNPAHG